MTKQIKAEFVGPFLKPVAGSEVFNGIVERYGGWDMALADVEKMASEAEERAARLRCTAAVIRRMIEIDEAWPGMS
jgi:hypothetical protein